MEIKKLNKTFGAVIAAILLTNMVVSSVSAPTAGGTIQGKVMIHIHRWCDTSYKSLLPSLTLTLFRQVMSSLRRGALGKDGFAWPEQEAFLLYPTGKAYAEKLIAIYDRKVEE